MWWLPPPSFCLPADLMLLLLLLLLISVFAEHFEGHGEKSVRDRGVGMRKGGVSSGSAFFLRFRWSVYLEVLSWKPQMTGPIFKSLMPLTRMATHSERLHLHLNETAGRWISGVTLSALINLTSKANGWGAGCGRGRLLSWRRACSLLPALRCRSRVSPSEERQSQQAHEGQQEIVRILNTEAPLAHQSGWLSEYRGGRDRMRGSWEKQVEELAEVGGRERNRGQEETVEWRNLGSV